MLLNRSLLILIVFVFSSLEPLQAWQPFKSIARFIKRTQNKIKASYFNLDVVEEGKLYRSGQLSPKELGRILNGTTFGVKIKTVINLRGASNQSWYFDEKRVCQDYGVELIDIPMLASCASSKENLYKLLRAFKKASRPILIHCQGGADRTGEAAALWKLEQQKESKAIALKQLTFKNRHRRSRYPAKSNLIKIWIDKKWFKTSYTPALITN